MKIACNIHVETLAKLTKHEAENIVNAIVDGELLCHFKGTVSGTVYIPYPLTTPDHFEVEHEKTIGGLLWEIAKRYEYIYSEEEKTNTSEILSESVPLLNRAKSNGKFGIYGHDIEDLFFEGIVINDDGIIELFVGS